jgi:macrodomain Ter protein organizer (MatP/YcbG family)
MLKTRTGQRTMKTKITGMPPAHKQTRRTTLTLPEDLVRKAEQLARQRRQTLSSSIAELMEQSLRSYRFKQDNNHSNLDSLQKAFAPFTEEEMLLLDGIVMEEPSADSE